MIQIENYISSFLIKNKYCAISGLGTLELKREPAQMRSADGEVYPPGYDITFSPIGVIDDGFATFIANHENVSISKASNDIKTFSQNAKHEMRKTGRFELDGVGKFTYKEGAIQFYQDETLDLEQDPIKVYQERVPGNEEEETLADAKSFKDLNYTHSEKGMGRPKTGTLLKYLLALLLLIGLAAASYFAYKYYQGNKSDKTNTTEEAASVEDFPEDVVSDSASVAAPTEVGESVADNSGSEEQASAPAVVLPGEHGVAVLSYDNKVSAKIKADKLVTFGNKASTIQRGDRHYVVITAAHSSMDTTLLKDSLKRFFNPSGSPFIVK